MNAAPNPDLVKRFQALLIAIEELAQGFPEEYRVSCMAHLVARAAVKQNAQQLELLGMVAVSYKAALRNHASRPTQPVGAA